MPVRSLDKRVPPERIVFDMPVQDQKDKEQDEREPAAAADAAPAPSESSGADLDERRAKMERLRAEGIDPYPPVSLPDRKLIKDVLAAHDPATPAPAEHPSPP